MQCPLHARGHSLARSGCHGVSVHVMPWCIMACLPPVVCGWVHVPTLPEQCQHVRRCPCSHTVADRVVCPRPFRRNKTIMQCLFLVRL